MDKDKRLVTLSRQKVRKVVFPSQPEKDAAILEVLRKEVAPITRTLALDRFAALLEASEADKAARSVELGHTPPKIVFSTTAALLAYVDGEPAWRPVKDTKLERAINTRVLLLRHGNDQHYLHVFDGWMAAKELEGPWKPEKKESKDLQKAVADAKASGQVDLLPGGNLNDPKTLPSLKQAGREPRIVVATTPTELIVTEGEPDYVPIEGTGLLYAKNTTGNVFKDTSDQRLYVLVSGRWFRAATQEGPWEYVANDALPAGFARIPDDSAKENVKAAVAGTPQAKESLISNLIPQTAEVKIADAKMDSPKYDGEPKLVAIEGTSLHYAANTATPVIQVSPTSYYAVENAVWFTSAAPSGPWAVATSVPSVIYTIPPTSPLYYVTYVKVYQTTPTTVYVGYTPGYYGTVVSHGTVVYGTGYPYAPYVGTTAWYGQPMTYGSGVGITYTPWTGWTYGFGMGWSWGSVTVGWGWGAYPWWGPVGWGYYYPYPYYRPPYWGGAAFGPWGGGAVWGPGGWAATTGNVYSRWGATSAVTRRSGGYNAWTGDAWRNSAGMSYNSRTGNLSAGQRSAVGNVYSGNYAYGGRGGVGQHQDGRLGERRARDRGQRLHRQPGDGRADLRDDRERRDGFGGMGPGRAGRCRARGRRRVRGQGRQRLQAQRGRRLGAAAAGRRGLGRGPGRRARGNARPAAARPLGRRAADGRLRPGPHERVRPGLPQRRWRRLRRRRDARGRRAEALSPPHRAAGTSPADRNATTARSNASGQSAMGTCPHRRGAATGPPPAATPPWAGRATLSPREKVPSASGVERTARRTESLLVELARGDSPRPAGCGSRPTVRPKRKKFSAADRLADLHVGAVERADGERAVHRELHVAGAGRLLAGGRDLLARGPPPGRSACSS